MAIRLAMIYDFLNHLISEFREPTNRLALNCDVTCDSLLDLPKPLKPRSRPFIPDLGTIFACDGIS
jgi:hypothetical protein